MKLSVAILTMILSLDPAYADREEGGREVRMRTISSAVLQATQRACCLDAYSENCDPIWESAPVDLAALIVAKGWWESRFALNVHEGKCKPYECDPITSRHTGKVIHLARTPWQFQKTAYSAPFWEHMVGTDLESTRNAAWVAATILSRGMRSCRSAQGAISWYAIGRCNWSRSKNRYFTYRRLQKMVAMPPST